MFLAYFLQQKANLSKLGYRWIEPTLDGVFKEHASCFSKQIFLHHGHESIWQCFFRWWGLWRHRASSSSFSPSESNSDCHEWSQNEGHRRWCRCGGDSSKGESLAKERFYPPHAGICLGWGDQKRYYFLQSSCANQRVVVAVHSRFQHLQMLVVPPPQRQSNFVRSDCVLEGHDLHVQVLPSPVSMITRLSAQPVVWIGFCCSTSNKMSIFKWGLKATRTKLKG